MEAMSFPIGFTRLVRSRRLSDRTKKKMEQDDVDGPVETSRSGFEGTEARQRHPNIQLPPVP